MSSAFSSYVHGTDAVEQQRLDLMNRIINEPSLRELNLTPGQRVLDVGSGTGQFSRLMARVVGEAGTVIGIEREEKQRATAERLAEAAGETGLVEFRRGDALDLPLAESELSSFDVVYSRFVLEHLNDPAAAVRQMVAAVRPGTGRIVLQDDEHDVMRLWPECEPFDEIWRAYYETYSKLGLDPHVGRKLVALLHEAGATPIRNIQLFYGACAGSGDFEPVIQNCIGVLEGARDTVLRNGSMRDADYSRRITAFQQWAERPDAALWYGMFVAEGKRDA